MKRRILTPAERQEVLDWHAARSALGTAKKIARKLGVTQHAIFAIMRRRNALLAGNAL